MRPQRPNTTTGPGVNWVRRAERTPPVRKPVNCARAGDFVLEPVWSRSAGCCDRRLLKQQAVQDLHDLVVNLVGLEPVGGAVPAGDRGQRAVEQVDRDGDVDVGADESLVYSLPEQLFGGAVHLPGPGLVVAQSL